MSVTWAQVEPLIGGTRHRELLELLARLEDVDRKPLVAPLRALSRSQDARGLPPWHLFGDLALVGVAVLPDARTTASWIRRFAQHEPLTSGPEQPDRHAEELAVILIGRKPSWLPQLVTLLAEQLRHNTYFRGPYTLVERLRSLLDADPPTGAGYVAGWVHFGWGGGDLVALLRAEPRFADLLPLVMENDDVAEELRGRSWTTGRIGLVTDALDAGLADRPAVLDALLARLQRGGRPKATNDFVAVHDALAPSPDEVVERRRDYLALLPAPSAGSVAGLAQRCLLNALEAGRLTLDELGEASRSTLTRGDKKLVRLQLAALREQARRSPVDLPRLADMVAETFDNAAPDLQRDAVKLLTAWLPSLDVEARDRVLDRARALPADLASQLGGTREDPPPVVSRLVPPERTPVEPMASVDELVEELLVVLRSEGWRIAPLGLDRILEAVPRLAGSDREALRRAARPVLASDTYTWAHHADSRADRTITGGLVALLDAALGNPVRPTSGTRGHTHDRVPQRALVSRVHAAAAALVASPHVRCVSLPSWSDGTIDASALHERLDAARAGGWTPDPIDLEQAALRVDPGAAGGLGLPSPPSPAITFVERKERYFPSWDGDEPPPPVYLPIPVMVPAADDGSPGRLWGLLRDLPAPEGDYSVGYDPGSTFQAWPLIVPHHPDVIAAHLCLDQVNARDRSSDEVGVLVGLAEAPGPAGPGLYAALAYGLGAKKADRQAAAVDAVLVLAARDRLDEAALGAMLGRIITQRALVLKRLCPPLSDIARGGAAGAAWAAIRAALESALRLAPAPSGLPDLLSSAAEIASLAGASGHVDGLDVLAGRQGKSRQLVEARRLQLVLA